MTEMDSVPVLAVHEDAGVQTWSMQQPPVNALSDRLLDELEAVLAAVAQRSDIAVIVIGSGLRVFSAGADASWMAAVVQKYGTSGLIDRFNGSMDRFRAICLGLRSLPALVIAAIDGHALAGGLELAVACDLRFASSAAKVQLGVPEMDLFGEMPSGGGGAQYLARLLGPARALEFILEAKPIDPQRALEIGLVDRLAPPGEVLAAAQAFASAVMKKAGPVGVAAAKRAVFGGVDLPLAAAIETDRTIHWDAMRRGNFAVGATAFIEQFGGSR